MAEQYRIFLGYRAGTQGEDFCRRLYDRIVETPWYQTLYGLPYFSPRTEQASNYLQLDFLQGVRYFVLPYTPDFFSRSGRERPVIFSEIEAALRYNPEIRFLPVIFPGFDPGTLREDFQRVLCPDVQDRLDLLVGSKFTHAVLSDEESCEEALMDLLLRELLQTAVPQSPNVVMTTKAAVEQDPLFSRLAGVRKLTLLNFAGTSFLTGGKTSDAYRDEVRDEFYKSLRRGDVEVQVILTEPGSAADRDACRYKMNGGVIRPQIAAGREIFYEELSENEQLLRHIIPYNLNEVLRFCQEQPQARASVYTTDMALPYSIMKCEYGDSRRNCMQVCLYTPLIEDAKRPAFVLREQDLRTRELYTTLDQSLTAILQKATPQKPRRSVDFLTQANRPILHRANLAPHAVPMTREAFAACAERGLPFECDLLFLRDTVAVWRDEPLGRYPGFTDAEWFSQLNRRELETLRSREGAPQILTLAELLELLETTARHTGQAPSPILAEIKDPWDAEERNAETIRRHAIAACQLLETYTGDWAACSSNPQVLRAVKQYDMRIPCGQITLDFSKGGYQVPPDYRRLHETAAFAQVQLPDFLACRIGDFGDLTQEPFDSLCRSHRLPRLGWVSHSPSQSRQVREHYDNLLIEYDPKEI